LINLWSKIQNVFTEVIYIAIGVGDIFWMKKTGFAKEASFDPETTISAMKLKFHATTPFFNY